jgi:hypothetical protein
MVTYISFLLWYWKLHGVVTRSSASVITSLLILDVMLFWDSIAPGFLEFNPEIGTGEGSYFMIPIIIWIMFIHIFIRRFQQWNQNKGKKYLESGIMVNNQQMFTFDTLQDYLSVIGIMVFIEMSIILATNAKQSMFHHFSQIMRFLLTGKEAEGYGIEGSIGLIILFLFLFGIYSWMVSTVFSNAQTDYMAVSLILIHTLVGVMGAFIVRMFVEEFEDSGLEFIGTIIGLIMFGIFVFLVLPALYGKERASTNIAKGNRW